MPEPHDFEVEIRVSAPGQETIAVHREYRTPHTASAEQAAREICGGFTPEVKARMRPVNDDA